MVRMKYDGSIEQWKQLAPISTKPGWKFFLAVRKHRESAVCLYDQIVSNLGFNTACKEIRSIKDQSPKSIKSHLKSAHGCDIDFEEQKKADEQKETLSNFLVTRKINQLTDRDSAITQLVCSDILTINRLINSRIVNNLFNVLLLLT